MTGGFCRGDFCPGGFFPGGFLWLDFFRGYFVGGDFILEPSVYYTDINNHTTLNILYGLFYLFRLYISDISPHLYHSCF